jgi:hypothetical protein
MPLPPPHRPERAARASLALALAAHALALAALAAARPAQAPSLALPATLEIELDHTGQTLAPDESAAAALVPGEAAVRAGARVEAMIPAGARPPTDGDRGFDAGEPPPGATVGEGVPPSDAGAPLVALRPDLEALGLGRTRHLLGRGGAGSGEGERRADDEGKQASDRAAIAKANANAALRSVLSAQDQDLGLGPGGPVATAIHDAVPRSLAPLRGRALLRARLDGGGSVVAIDVLDAVGARAEWLDAARLALGALKGTVIRMPKGARSGEVRVEVSSAVRLASGRSVGADPTPAQGGGQFAFDVTDLAGRTMRVAHARVVGTAFE